MVACSVVEYSKPPSTSVRFTKIGEVSSLVERPSFTDTFELRRLDMIHFGSVAIIIDLTFTFVAAKNFRKDIDNLIKFALDAMQLSGVFDNDAQVVEVRARKEMGDEDATKINIYRKELIIDE